LTVQISTKLNRAHLVTGRTALILPCLGRSERDVRDSGEQFVTTEDSMGIINTSRGKLEPASPFLLSEPAIVCRIAQACSTAAMSPTSIPWREFEENYDLIRDRIARVVPGFDNYNQRVREGSFYLANAPRDRREWKTKKRPRQLCRGADSKQRRRAGRIRHDDDPHARSIQHDGLRLGRSLSRRVRRTARRVHA
jgi:hypothetical protein